MYRHYRAYIGNRTFDDSSSINWVLDDINQRNEEIVSVVPAVEGYWVLIITKSPREVSNGKG